MQIQVISMMFNQDGGMMLSKKGTTVREWMWPPKGKLDDPVESWTFHNVNTVSEEARKLVKAYKVKCKQMKCIAQNKDPSSLADSVDIATFDPVMNISPMSDMVAIIKLRELQIKAKHILFQWLDHYRSALGIKTRHICKMPKFLRKVVRRRISTAKFPLKQSTKESNENKEYLRYRNAFLKLKGVFKPLPLCQIQKTSQQSTLQCRSDAFRLMKYNVITASKFTSSKSPLLVQRHNVIPGVFLGKCEVNCSDVTTLGLDFFGQSSTDNECDCP